MSEIDKKKKITQFIKVTNKWMKKIGEKLEIESKMCTYVTRHSYSTIMLQNNVPLTHISKSLGHSSIATTEAYFASFEDDRIKEYMKVLE